jgi:hypothetical protein
MYIGTGNLCSSKSVGVKKVLINKGAKSRNLELNQKRPSAADVRNGWWPHAVESRGNCRANQELPLQVLHGGSQTVNSKQSKPPSNDHVS